MNVVMLTNYSANQKALASKFHKAFGLKGIVFSKNIPKRKKSLWMRLRVFFNRIQGRLFGGPYVQAWTGLQSHYDQNFQYPPAIEELHVNNINDPRTVEFLKSLNVDLVLVSGTNLVGKAIIEYGKSKNGVLNLHTGISPYIKGGPNCTNWCLAKNKLEMIGNTVMWIDLGIDTGNIICTERTPVTGNESLPQLHLKVMEHAHEIYVRSAQRIIEGFQAPNVQQNSLAEGDTFNSWEWNGIQMLKGLWNFKNRFNENHIQNEGFKEKVKALKLVNF